MTGNQTYKEAKTHSQTLLTLVGRSFSSPFYSIYRVCVSMASAFALRFFSPYIEGLVAVLICYLVAIITSVLFSFLTITRNSSHL